MTDDGACLTVFLGRIDYLRALELQRSVHERVVSGRLPNVLLLLEHPHVFTLGRRGKLSDILASAAELQGLGVEVHHIDRGGEVTYHGPGQLVGYPIVSIRQWGGGPLRYVRMLEEVLVATAADFGLRAERGERPTGVWVGDAKLAAIGVKISRGVTMHGFALNVAPDLSYFDRIVPCGMPDAQVTSMAALLADEIMVQQVVPVLMERFGETFGLRVSRRSLEEVEPVSFSLAEG
jgi:lipoate-protein ligase B